MVSDKVLLKYDEIFFLIFFFFKPDQTKTHKTCGLYLIQLSVLRCFDESG